MKDPALKAWAETSTRFMLSMVYRLDMCMAACGDFAILKRGQEADDAILKALEEEGVNHAAAVAEARKNTKEQPLAPSLADVGSNVANSFVSFLEALQKLDVGAKNRSIVKSVLTEIDPFEAAIDKLPSITRLDIEMHVHLSKLQSSPQHPSQVTTLQLHYVATLLLHYNCFTIK